MKENITKTDLTVVLIIMILFNTVGFVLLLTSNQSIKDEINASKRLEQIEDRAYQQHNPETQMLLDYVVFGESQI